MLTFAVTVTNWAGIARHYTTRAAHSFDAWDEAVTKFGLCKIRVTAQ
jgi:hypothetical protein